MDRVEQERSVERTLDAIEADLDDLEAALGAGSRAGSTGALFDLPESRATDLQARSGTQGWTDAQRTRAIALLARNRHLAEQLAIRMRETTHARQFLGILPSQPRYLDTIA